MGSELGHQGKQAESVKGLFQAKTLSSKFIIN